MRAMAFVLRAELVKYWAEFRYYGFNYFFSTLGQALLFLGIVGAVAHGGQVSPQGFFKMLLGFLMWWYAMGLMWEMSYIAWEDAVLGTLEHVYMSPTPFGLVLLARALAGLIRDTGWFLVVAGVSIGVYTALGGSLSLPGVNWAGVGFVMAFPLISSGALGLAIFGLALVFKRVGSVVNLLQWVLLVFSGVLFDPGSQPAWLRALAWASPIGPGAEALRRLVVDGAGLWEVMLSWNGALLLANAGAYGLLGAGFFQLFLREAKRRGKMSRY